VLNCCHLRLDHGSHADADDCTRKPRDVLQDKRRREADGELVDYYNVFRNMKEALKNYARGEEGVEAAPVQEKEVLFQLLQDSIVQGMQFCSERDIDLGNSEVEGCIQERRFVWKICGQITNERRMAQSVCGLREYDHVAF
jgi:hypothetical protein